MVKAIFYENDGGKLHNCFFAGLDRDGLGQWVVADQGSELIMLSDYQDLSDVEFLLLCLEGEKVTSRNMAQLLGCVVQGYYGAISMLEDCLKDLKRRNVIWDCDPLEIKVYLWEYHCEVRNQNMLKLKISGSGFVAELDDIFTVDLAMDIVKGYFTALEMGAGINVSRKTLIIEEKLKVEVSREDKAIFNKIETW